jgi:PAS domain S-box-containing protein
LTAPAELTAPIDGLVTPDPGAGLVRLFEALARQSGMAATPDGTGVSVLDSRYRTFLEALAVAVYTTDASGRITYFNEAAVELWGRRPELGEEWCGSLRLFHLDGRPMAHGECPMAIALRENRAVRGSAAIAERPDGRRVVFEPFPTPLRAPDGALVGAVNVLVDVTDRLAAESALRATAAALEVSNAVKDEFLGLVSHELRTPVTTIFGNAMILHGREGLGPTERALAGDIADDAERLQRVVENLLQLTRLGAGEQLEREPQVIDHLVERSIAAFARRHPERPIVLTRPPGSTVVDADATSLELVVGNLIGNAHQYSPAGAPIDAELTRDGSWLRVEILDRGIGLPDGDPEELFAAFFRAEAARRTAAGIGIGLAVCRRVVEAHSGTIWAAPRDGGGSRIGFALPVSFDGGA